jgi:tetratricopeptide (TPR) repeat protein
MLSRRALVCAVAVCAVGTLFRVASVFAQGQELPAPEAWAALDRGDAAKAAAIFRDELDRSPRNAMLYYGAGYANFALGRSDAAISLLKHAIEYDPKFVSAMVLLAQVAYQSADLDLALRTIEKAAALAPADRRIAQQLEQWRKESAVHNSLEEKLGTHFNVLYEGSTDRALGDHVAKVLESAYWRIGQTLSIYPSETLNVILYTNRQFRDITRAPAWAGGGYDGRIRLPVGGALRSPKSLERVVTHEFVHAAIRSAAANNVPTWVNEGLASYLEGPDHTWAAQVIKAAPELIRMEDLVNGFDEFDGPTALVAYAESLVAGQLLCEKLGPNVGTFLQMLGSGHSVDQALSTHNVQPDAFYAEWRKRIGAK